MARDRPNSLGAFGGGGAVPGQFYWRPIGGSLGSGPNGVDAKLSNFGPNLVDIVQNFVRSRRRGGDKLHVSGPALHVLGKSGIPRFPGFAKLFFVRRGFWETSFIWARVLGDIVHLGALDSNDGLRVETTRAATETSLVRQNGRSKDPPKRLCPKQSRQVADSRTRFRNGTSS